MKYPVFKPLITKEDKEHIMQCLEEGWISSNGPYINKFEESFANYIGVKYAISVSNGTSALEVALAALGINSGEIILPSFTIASCAYAIQRVGAKPVFVDVDKDYLCIDPELVRKKINKNTKAIMIVNMYGNTCDVKEFLKIRDEFGIPIVEDCSENLGGSYSNKLSGSVFDVATFSLYANKTITSGEGGVVCTSSEIIFEKAKKYKNLDFDSSRTFTHNYQAYNFRLSAPQCALAFSQLKRINSILKTKDEIFYKYLSYIDSDKLNPLKVRPNTKFVPWMNCFRVKKSDCFSFKDFAEYMLKNDVQIRPYFSSLESQKAFKFEDTSSNFYNSRLAAKDGFYLPSSLELSDEDISIISTKVNQYFND
jgi:perosamine synthetase